MMIPPGMTDTGVTGPDTGLTPLSAPKMPIMGNPMPAPPIKDPGILKVGPENTIRSQNKRKKV